MCRRRNSRFSALESIRLGIACATDSGYAAPEAAAGVVAAAPAPPAAATAPGEGANFGLFITLAAFCSATESVWSRSTMGKGLGRWRSRRTDEGSGTPRNASARSVRYAYGVTRRWYTRAASRRSSPYP